MKITPWILLFSMLPLLSGCKSELYSKLDEKEANQMMALLIYNKIPADKRMEKDGVTLLVDQDRFVDAVEVLRQNGLPRPQTVTMQELFPSGQLVTSPEQEEAKLNYLKSQQIEKMLSSMDGVINAEVSVAEPRAIAGEAPPLASAAVFIKYSPDVNLPAREAEIRALINNGIPGLAPDRISVTLQRAEYRYQPPGAVAAEDHKIILYGYPLPLEALIAAACTLLFGLLISLTLWLRRPRRSTP
ncbi:type III secretion inner membrane ring lipoprotein SctJ [Edwardsiella ictaluri]|uniref:type III secretion system inner membrane ring lipoprotein SctJ n=1 Tax=Edwardsiella ictaluri TaxID=67780 RepID=UPI0009C14180|nr:type III secretion inner membrane ring lipoprotein SctJ [Edwardsiella ictaluri]ARD40540.1 EscJ/YscJ/HrcJ family type III secretion inner membrane ring protein [Edwardsiella ictaluri]QPW26090.1 type III secretion inner membrane ring lipoprotein SctJ [Edwardsiella ictaluri]